MCLFWGSVWLRFCCAVGEFAEVNFFSVCFPVSVCVYSVRSFMVRACGTCHCSGGRLHSRGRRWAAAWLPPLWWCPLTGRNTGWCLLLRHFPLCHREWRSYRCTPTCHSSPAGRKRQKLAVAASEYTNPRFLQLKSNSFNALYLFIPEFLKIISDCVFRFITDAEHIKKTWLMQCLQK